MRRYFIFILIVYMIAAGFTGPAASFAGTRAFSLTQFQDQWEQAGKDTDNAILLYLCGINRVDGFVTDAENQDVVVYGQVLEDRMPLYTNDFVIALRNAWMVYAELKDNTYYYSNPGCSIDPNAKVLAQLNELSQRLNSVTDAEAKDTVIEMWHDICKLPQTVRVFGIPFESRFASVMVDADYLLKRIVDGSFVPDVNGITGLLPAVKSQMETDIRVGNSITVGIASMNRFWFYPGDYQFSYDDQVAKIDDCPVTLLTESQYLHSSEKKLMGSGKADPMAEAFTNNFTSHYQELAETEPLYAELEELFRLVALAKLMEYYKLRNIVDMDYLLEQHAVGDTPVPKTLEGISRIERFEHTREIENGTETIKLWLPSCGGVGIDMEVGPDVLQKDIEGKLNTLKKRVLDARPQKDALFWDVEN